MGPFTITLCPSIRSILARPKRSKLIFYLSALRTQWTMLKKKIKINQEKQNETPSTKPYVERKIRREKKNLKKNEFPAIMPECSMCARGRVAFLFLSINRRIHGTGGGGRRWEVDEGNEGEGNENCARCWVRGRRGESGRGEVEANEKGRVEHNVSHSARSCIFYDMASNLTSRTRHNSRAGSGAAAAASHIQTSNFFLYTCTSGPVSTVARRSHSPGERAAPGTSALVRESRCALQYTFFTFFLNTIRLIFCGFIFWNLFRRVKRIIFSAPCCRDCEVQKGCKF